MYRHLSATAAAAVRDGLHMLFDGCDGLPARLPGWGVDQAGSCGSDSGQTSPGLPHLTQFLVGRDEVLNQTLLAQIGSNSQLRSRASGGAAVSSVSQ